MHFVSRRKEESFKLSIEKVIENICTDEIKIIDSLYNLVFHLLNKEDERLSSLDSKGSNILGMAGVALALIFSLGGLLIEKIEDTSLIFLNSVVYILSILYILTNFLLLISIIFAVFSVRARSDFKTVSDVDIFTKEISKGENYYKRYIVAHFWQIYQNNFIINERKGFWLKYSYWFFTLSMVFLLLISITIGLYSLNKHSLL